MNLNSIFHVLQVFMATQFGSGYLLGILTICVLYFVKKAL